MVKGANAYLSSQNGANRKLTEIMQLESGLKGLQARLVQR